MRPQRHQDALHMTLKIKYEHSENISFNNCYGLLIGPAPPSGGPPCAPVNVISSVPNMVFKYTNFFQTVELIC